MGKKRTAGILTSTHRTVGDWTIIQVTAWPPLDGVAPRVVACWDAGNRKMFCPDTAGRRKLSNSGGRFAFGCTGLG